MKPMIEVKTIPAVIDQVERQLEALVDTESEKKEKPKKKAAKKEK